LMIIILIRKIKHQCPTKVNEVNEYNTGHWQNAVQWILLN